ncbi:uncharacterized protein SPPG_02207 [Spizellomyces punctatus DAOM BR117]|uniref:Transmembrane adaptor Erv26 n=1 Tax=Spizellomyces punctatus (strain DAOM BR117) TaxID=645134 RepID=A0A0L0HQQ6_SPIPD|nr:uncharacterized protein SPPG_02207 [Spizellomyces punctatus DAOM BR117]KND03144.1 hypothetical protein SPPG_02207 [Spizellomyces punctatus DAOM BR117]|eukprot:XP_016611183.1 hypothetical protein SPPG_02207 [Spizellomyces punctatus DAOM BR117]
MIFLSLLTYLGGLLGFAFITLSLACGLYYLAELVEEHTVLTKRVIKYATIATMAAHVLLWLVDGLPFLRILFSLSCHLWYSQLLRTFPTIELSSVAFVLSCVLVIVDHFVWFFYFTDHYHTFMEIATFFGLIVWLIPFMYFISLSANEYTLPAFDTAARETPQRKKTNLVKTIASYLGVIKGTVLPDANSRKPF